LCAAGIGAPHIRQRLFWVAYRSGEGLSERISNAGVQREAGCAQQGEASELCGATGGVVNAASSGAGGDSGRCAQPEGRGKIAGVRRCEDQRLEYSQGDRREQWRPESVRRIPAVRRCESGFWAEADYLYCSDGKYRPVEPGTFPLAHGVSGRVAQLRGLGNAIVPQITAAFIVSAMESLLTDPN
jgi:DNA (cytosine-5)-methyltransferase 1